MRVITAAQRQAELEARHRDLTKVIPPPGTDGDSLRALKGFESVTDEMLAERATFNLKDHMRGAKITTVTTVDAGEQARTVDMAAMSPEELRGLIEAAARELEQKEPDNA